MGELRWTPAQAQSATVADAILALKHHRERAVFEDKANWERARMMMFYSIAPWAKNLKKATDLFPFPWEQARQRVKPRTTGEALQIVLGWEKELQAKKKQ